MRKVSQLFARNRLRENNSLDVGGSSAAGTIANNDTRARNINLPAAVGTNQPPSEVLGRASSRNSLIRS